MLGFIYLSKYVSFVWEISECGRFYAPDQEQVQLREFLCLCESLPHRTGGLAGMHVVIQLEKLKKSEKLYFIQPLYINNHAFFILMLLSLRNTFNKEKIQQLK